MDMALAYESNQRPGRHRRFGHPLADRRQRRPCAPSTAATDVDAVLEQALTVDAPASPLTPQQAFAFWQLLTAAGQDGIPTKTGLLHGQLIVGFAPALGADPARFCALGPAGYQTPAERCQLDRTDAVPELDALITAWGARS